MIIEEKTFPVKDLETPKFICLNKQTKSWNVHNRAAMDKEASLVSIMCKEQNDEVKAIMNGRTTWIGANDKESEGTWKWSEDDSTFWSHGTTLLYSDWKSNEPNNSQDEHCGGIRSDRKWNDFDCDDNMFQAVYLSDETIENMECKQYSSKYFCSILTQFLINISFHHS